MACQMHSGRWVRGPRIATTCSDRGIGVRAPEVWYDQASKAGAMFAPVIGGG